MVKVAAAKVLVIAREMVAATEAGSENVTEVAMAQVTGNEKVTEAAMAHAMAQVPSHKMERALINST